MEKSTKILLVVVFSAMAVIALIGVGIYLSIVSDPGEYIELVMYFVIGALVSIGVCLLVWALFLSKLPEEDTTLDSNILGKGEILETGVDWNFSELSTYIKNNLHQHAITQKDKGIDSDYVIIDKRVYYDLLLLANKGKANSQPLQHHNV